MEKPEYVDINLDKSLNNNLIFNVYAGSNIKNLVKNAPNKEFADLLREFWMVKFHNTILVGNTFSIMGDEAKLKEIEIISKKFAAKSKDIIKKITDNMESSIEFRLSIGYTMSVMAEIANIFPELGIDNHILD